MNLYQVTIIPETMDSKHNEYVTEYINADTEYEAELEAIARHKALIKRVNYNISIETELIASI